MKNFWNSLRVRNKIALPIVAVSLLSGIATFFFTYNMYKDAGTAALIEKARTMVLAAESAREFTADQMKNNVFQTNLTNVDQVLRTVPIFAAMEVARKKSTELGYTMKTPKFSPRNPDNQPDEFEAEAIRTLESNTSQPEYWKIDEQKNSVRYFRAISLSQECMKCHGDPAQSVALWGNAEGKDITGARMENWKVGEVHGAFEISMKLDALQADVQSKSLLLALIAFISAIVIVSIALFVARTISAHIGALKQAAETVANGDTTVSVETVSSDEIGALGTAFNKMVSNIRTAMTTVQQKSIEADQAAHEAHRAKSLAEEHQQYLTQSVSVILTEMKHFADGDLTVALEVQGEDAIALLCNGFNQAVMNINSALVQVNRTTDQTRTASERIATSIHQMSAASEEQARQTLEISEALDRLSGTIKANALRTTDAAAQSTQVSASADEGGSIMASTMENMKRVAQIVTTSSDQVRVLGDSSKEIGEIIQVIEEIADQTNLLALNAAIEAARAGDQGRGFAVVADEVRKLAERTAGATKQISTMIKHIQTQTSTVVDAMHEGTHAVESGTVLMSQTSQALQEIITGARTTSILIQELSEAGNQQAVAITNIASNLEGITSTVQETSVVNQEIAQSASELNTLTEELEAMIQRFHVSEQQEEYQDQPVMMRHAHSQSSSPNTHRYNTQHSTKKLGRHMSPGNKTHGVLSH